MTAKKETTPAIKLRQNICGWLGILMCLCLLCYHGARFLNLLDATVYYMLPSSVCEVLAYVMLFSLASSLASEIFAMAQTAVEVFFAIALPYMLTHVFDMQQLDKWIFATLVAFCTVSLYFWVVLFNNNKFNQRDRWWIMLLPVLQALEMCVYLTYLYHIRGLDDVNNPAFCVPMPLRLTKMALVLLLPVSWWKISHSSAFAGNNDGMRLPSFSPWNRYGLICLVLVAMAIAMSFVIS